jgi:hypothetical protein
MIERHRVLAARRPVEPHLDEAGAGHARANDAEE